MPDRAHHFWVCLVPRSIIENMQRQLDAFFLTTGGPGVQLTVQHVWLCEVPHGVQPWLWRTVCMAAVSAMDFWTLFHGVAEAVWSLFWASISRFGVQNQ